VAIAHQGAPEHVLVDAPERGQVLARRVEVPGPLERVGLGLEGPAALGFAFLVVSSGLRAGTGVGATVVAAAGGGAERQEEADEQQQQERKLVTCHVHPSRRFGFGISAGSYAVLLALTPKQQRS
jgi:hypothetical protein